MADLPGASELFLIIRVASALQDDKEHTEIGAITSPHPLSVFTSIALIIFLLRASLWAERYFIFSFIFTNAHTMVGSIFLASLGQFGPIFFTKYVHAASLRPLLGYPFLYLLPHSILQMRWATFPTVEKSWTLETATA